MQVILNNSHMNRYRQFDPAVFQALFEKEGISEHELEDKTGIPQPTIYRIRKGVTKNPTFQMLKRLAEHYGVTLSQFTGEDPLDIDAVAETQIHWIELIIDVIVDFEQETGLELNDAQRARLLRLAYKAMYKQKLPRETPKEVTAKIIRKQIGKVFSED